MPPRRTLLDAGLAVALFLATASCELGTSRYAGTTRFSYLDWQPPLWSSVPVGLAVGASVWWRRRHPVLPVPVALVSFVLLGVASPVLFAQYNLAARTASWRKVAAATLVTSLVVAAPVLRWGGPDAAIPISAAICAAPALLGLYLGAHRELVASLRERAERAEREQHERVLRARADERGRIARDMHDVVTHRVSLMVLHATALEVAADDPAATGRRTGQISQISQISQIGQIGREALDELRALVAVLRADDDPAAPLAPQPGLAEIADLVADARRSGSRVTLRMPPGDAAPKPPLLVEHALYRVAQEALSNARKHAPDANTRVTVEPTRAGLRLSVANGPAPPTGELPGGELPGGDLPGGDLPGGGYGLLGIAERVHLVGGTFSSGRTADGGFELVADVPLPGHEVTG